MKNKQGREIVRDDSNILIKKKHPLGRQSFMRYLSHFFVEVFEIVLDELSLIFSNYLDNLSCYIH
jgi:hypothetical protein